MVERARMTRGVRLYLVGSFVLVSLAGCGRGFFQSAEREPWRAEAEVACLKSGVVKENPELVRIDPISGPGVCGAEYPLKVAALGEGSSSFGFADDLRPPGSIANAPRWPIAAPPPRAAPPSYPEPSMRPSGYGAPSSGPISLTAPGVTQQDDDIALPAEGTAGAGPRAVSQSAGLSAARSRCSTLFGAPRHAAAAAARAGAGQPGLGIRAGDDEAHGDAGLSDRLGARSLARRFRAAGGAALVRLRAWPRSSRSRPIPAAA